ncbi:class I SAM-dependent methyltransferase [Halostreptopolyspora alba]|uniref:Class I SAM-dependent methyltransferase n=1 Tax=Halostreptopolyspora alba TaxID=2487137 RepID=A0A3N0EFS6_9ACTN|nr:class I SAM-dependent methyltransferase [Nocardiopsaceae bacterium YIM 96095]
MRLPKARLWVPPAAVATCGAGFLVTFRGFDVLGWATTLELAALGTVGMAVGVLVIMVRRVAYQVRRLSQVSDTNTRGISEAIGECRVELTGAVEGARAEFQELRGDLENTPAAIAERVDEYQPGNSRELTEHITRQGCADHGQQAAWWELRDFLRPASFMPALRGWAESPDVLRLVARAIGEHRPKLVVECGSGSSSIWLGYALRKAGTGKLVALEHDERYARLTRDMVAAHGLSDIVDVRHAPLADWRSDPDAGFQDSHWYSLDFVRDLVDIELLFIGGPPAGTGKQDRYPAGPILFPLCSPSAMVVLDDADRADEQAIGDRWLADDPDLRREVVAAEKGTHVFTWRSA